MNLISPSISHRFHWIMGWRSEEHCLCFTVPWLLNTIKNLSINQNIEKLKMKNEKIPIKKLSGMGVKRWNVWKLFSTTEKKSFCADLHGFFIHWSNKRRRITKDINHYIQFSMINYKSFILLTENVAKFFFPFRSFHIGGWAKNNDTQIVAGYWLRWLLRVFGPKGWVWLWKSWNDWFWKILLVVIKIFLYTCPNTAVHIIYSSLELVRLVPCPLYQLIIKPQSWFLQNFSNKMNILPIAS